MSSPTESSQPAVPNQKFAHRASFTMPAEISAIPPVIKAVAALAARYEAVPCLHDLELALQEALANAVLHGSGGDRSKTVQCICSCDTQNGILIVVRDSGSGFDPDSVRPPLEEHNIFQDHGRGIFMIRHLMDEVHFERGGSEIHMRKFKSNGRC